MYLSEWNKIIPFSLVLLGLQITLGETLTRNEGTNFFPSNYYKETGRKSDVVCRPHRNSF